MYRCLSDKIADTLRGELVAGRYGPGRDFPSVDALRQRFGAGEYAIRHALHKLRSEGLVSILRGFGSAPTKKVARAFRGRIAFIGVGTTGSYFPQMLSVQLARRFREAGGYPTGHADYATPTYTGGYTNTPHLWTTDRDYFVGLFEVTQGQHLKCGISASGFSGEGYDNSLLPQTSWSWFKCNGNVYNQNLCAAPKSTAANNYSVISRLKAKTDLNGFTLPSSVMWEIAARAGATTIYPWGDSWDGANAFAGWSPQRTIAVGSRNSNSWGLFDMIGNAAEQTLDSYLRFDLATVPADPWTPVTEKTLGLSRNFRMEVRGGRAPNATTSNELKASQRSNYCNYEESNNCLGFRVFFLPNQ